MKKNDQQCVSMEFVKPASSLMKLSRRQLLKRGAVVGSSFLIGGGFIGANTASWAMEVKGIDPAMMATLVQMARDVYPHDRFSDELYAVAVKEHDLKAAESPEHKKLIESGIATLDAEARALGKSGYLQIGWESERLAILKSIEASQFFQTVRGGLVVGLYNQEAVWAILGYEGSSYEQGGYLERGFDDISWV